MTNEEFQLLHSGVKGMRWGIRKKSTGSSDSTNPPKPKKLSKRQRKKEALKVVEASNKRSKSWRKDFNKREALTDTELKARIDRLKLENEFDKLSKDASSSVKAKGGLTIKKVMDMKMPKLKEDGTVDTSKTVGDIVAQEAIKLALKQFNTMQDKKTPVVPIVD